MQHLSDPFYVVLALITAFVLGIAVGIRVRTSTHSSRHAASTRRARRDHAVPQQPMTVDDALDALTPTERAAIEALLAQGHRIEAIKELRVALGTGLKEARDIAQELEDRLPRKPS